MKLILLVILLPLATFAAQEPNIEEQDEKCVAALSSAKSEVKSRFDMQYSKINSASAHAVDGPSGQPITTGNPMTDLVTSIGSTIQENADRATQISQARGQVDDDCFQQLVQLQDKSHDIRQKDYERRRQVGNSETEKLRQESEIRSKCWGEASQFFQTEMARLATYSQRIVGSVGGATKSQKDIQALRTNFYNYCMNSGPTKEALNMSKNDLDNKMRNFGIIGEELAADLNYHESTKTAQLKEHCKLRQERIDEQESNQKNASMQKLGLQLMGLNYAMQSANASSKEKEIVLASYQSLEDVLNNWSTLEQGCANIRTNTSEQSKVTNVPADVADVFAKVNRSCRPSGTNRTCVSSSGTNSLEKQRADRALSSQSQ